VNEALGGAGDPFTTLADVVGFTTREVFGSTLRIAYDITPNLTLRSTTTYRTSAYDYLEDSEGLPPSPFVDLTSEPQLLATLPAESGFAFDIADAVQENTNQYTQTFRLTSNPQRRFSWDVGLFGTFEDFERTEAFTNPSLGGPSGLPSINISDQENETIAFAVFGEAYYNITDRLELTVGARFDYEEKEYTASGSVPQGLPLLVFPFAEDTASESFSNPSGRFALDYALTPSVNVYGLFSTGFKSGGFTGSPSTAERAFTPFDSETALNYEAGLKGGFFDNRLRINLSAFWIDYNDLQVTRFFQPLGNDFGEFITENAGEARSRGLELEYNARPFENVLLGGSYSFLDAEFVDFQGTPSVAADGTVLDSGDFNGNDLRQAPNHTASFFAEYTYPFANGSEFKAKVNYRYQGEFFFDPDNNTLAFSEAYSLVDARLAYTFRDGQWELAVFGRNLTDEEYLTHAFTQRGSRISFGLFGDPRIFGGSVTFRM
jgi:iron complex outermembrane receptor protein